MRRHAFDPASFVLGLVVAGVAIVYLVAEGTDRSVDGAWVLPIALIGLGLAALAAGLTRALRLTRSQVDQPPAADAPLPGDNPGEDEPG